MCKSKKHFIIGGIYRHPNTSIADFSLALGSTLEKIEQLTISTYVAGDLNIDLLKYESVDLIKKYFDNLVIHSCLPLILQPTRITERSTTLIDHMYMCPGKYYEMPSISSGNIITDITDHLPNFAIVKNLVMT